MILAYIQFMSYYIRYIESSFIIREIERNKEETRRNKGRRSKKERRSRKKKDGRTYERGGLILRKQWRKNV